jgi:hypothetical protein
MSDVRADQASGVPCDGKEIGKAVIYCMAVSTEVHTLVLILHL